MSADYPKFRTLSLHRWRQLETVEITFHPRLTILTGANASGKTTILNILSRHFGWQISFVAGRRKRSVKKRDTDLYYDYWEDEEPGEEQEQPPQQSVGELTYTAGQKATLRVPSGESPTYQISVDGQQNVRGIHISSHRTVVNYQKIETIPAVPQTSTQVFSTYSDEIRNSYMGARSRRTAHHVLKETLASLAVFGYGNDAVTARREYAEIFEGFQVVLASVLPDSLGFERLTVDIPEITVVTKSGSFPLDSASGGIAAILDVAWQIYTYSLENKEFVVTFDEPENHLHPELQRQFLPRLIKTFEGAQFVVATHNPFVVGSVPESTVYVLRYNEGNRVVSSVLDQVNKAGSSNEILREVLGLSFTMPVWVEERLGEIVRRYSSVDLTAENLRALREEMRGLGMSEVFPEAVDRIIGEGKSEGE